MRSKIVNDSFPDSFLLVILHQAVDDAQQRAGVTGLHLGQMPFNDHEIAGLQRSLIGRTEEPERSGPVAMLVWSQGTMAPFTPASSGAY